MGLFWNRTYNLSLATKANAVSIYQQNVDSSSQKYLVSKKDGDNTPTVECTGTGQEQSSKQLFSEFVAYPSQPLLGSSRNASPRP